MNYESAHIIREESGTGLNARWLAFAAIAATVVMCIFVLRGSLTTPFSFDDSYNLTVTRNLGSHFRYAAPYMPEKVYDRAVTTNGPMQYIGAAVFAATKNIDAAAAAGEVSGILLLCIGLFLLRPVLVFMVPALFFAWPTFHFASTKFIGEIFATGCALIGFALLERVDAISSVRVFLRSRITWGALIALAAAVATKFLLFFFIVPVLLSIVISKDCFSSNNWWKKGSRAGGIAAILAAIILLLFFAQYAFSVAHTLRTIDGLASIPTRFGDFLLHHFEQGETNISIRVGVLQQLSGFTSHLVLLLIALAAAVIFLRRALFAPVVLVGCTIWLGAGLLERRMLPLFLIVLALGIREAAVWLDGQAIFSRRPTSAFAALGTIGLLLLFGAAGKTSHARKADRADPNREWATALWHGHYTSALLHHIQEQPYVVATGWWQMPEFSARWGVRIYNRTDPSNLFLPKDRTALLFYPKNHLWPATSEAANCGALIYRDGPIELCKVRTDVPLDYQRTGDDIPSNAVRAEMGLWRNAWKTSPEMEHAAGNSVFRYVGTGLPADELAWTTVSVTPGNVYVFSARISTSTLLGQQAVLKIDAPDGHSTYASMYAPAQPDLRFSTPPWQCPEGVHRVNITMQLLKATVQRGKTFAFSEPSLTIYSDRASGARHQSAARNHLYAVSNKVR